VIIRHLCDVIEEVVVVDDEVVVDKEVFVDGIVDVLLRVIWKRLLLLTILSMCCFG